MKNAAKDERGFWQTFSNMLSKPDYEDDNLLLSPGLIMWIGHRKEIQKQMFWALAVRRGESRSYGLYVVNIQKYGATLLVCAW